MVRQGAKMAPSPPNGNREEPKGAGGKGRSPEDKKICLFMISLQVGTSYVVNLHASPWSRKKSNLKQPFSSLEPLAFAVITVTTSATHSGLI